MPIAPGGAFRSTLIVSITRVLHTALGVGLGVLSARYFGASAAKDCYLVAQTIPGLVTTFLMGGVYSSLLLALSDIGRHEGIVAQAAFTRRSLGRVTLILGPFLIGGAFFPRLLVGAFAPGFDADRIALSARILSLTAIGALLSVYFVVLRCLYETRQQFIVPCLVNLLMPLASIATLAALVDRMGIFALAAGPLLGTVAAVALLFGLIPHVLRDSPDFVPGSASADEMARRARGFWLALLPMSLAANFGQMNLMIDNAFASFLPTGTITMLGFAYVIIANSELLTVLSLQEIAFPRLAAAAQQGTAELTATLRWCLRYMTLMTAPLSAGALAFGVPLIRLLFQRGEFGEESTIGVSRILACYSLEILFAGYLVLFSRLLFARRRFRTVAWTSSAAIAANGLLDYLLMKPFGVNGIALATTCVSLLHALILLPLVRKEVPSFHGSDDRRFLARVLASAALMGLVVFTWRWVFEARVDLSREFLRLLEVGVGLTLGAGFYVGMLHVLHVEEARALLRRLVGSVPLLAAR